MTIIAQERAITVVSVGQKGTRGETGLAGAGLTDLFVSVQNDEGGAMVRGQPVALVSGVGKKASSLASPTAGGKVYGLVYDETILPGGFGSVITDHVLTALTSEWDVVTGTSGGLVAGATYFLSVVAGQLTRTPDLSAGVVSRVGYALSTTKLRLLLDSPITL